MTESVVKIDSSTVSITEAQSVEYNVLALQENIDNANKAIKSHQDNITFWQSIIDKANSVGVTGTPEPEPVLNDQPEE